MIKYIEIGKSSTIEQTTKNIRRQTNGSNDSEYVKKIMNDVEKNKDKSLLKYSLKFDKVRLTVNELKVKNKEIQEAYTILDPIIVKELKNLKKSIEMTEKKIMKAFKSSVKNVPIRENINAKKSNDFYLFRFLSNFYHLIIIKLI